MIAPVGLQPVAAPDLTSTPAASADAGFALRLEDAVSRVDQAVQGGDDALVALASGGEVDLHGAMIALQEADIALRAMVSVRDRAIGAYEQLMNLAI